ncbi:hypothetical protein ABH926_005859 [Catenulispora sp. GP43]
MPISMPATMSRAATSGWKTTRDGMIAWRSAETQTAPKTVPSRYPAIEDGTETIAACSMAERRIRAGVAPTARSRAMSRAWPPMTRFIATPTTRIDMYTETPMSQSTAGLATILATSHGASGTAPVLEVVTR